MTSLKGDRAAQRKLRLKKKLDQKIYPQRGPASDPYKRVRNVNINNLDDILDDTE